MKKFIFLSLLLIIMGAVNANAQVIIGGSSTDNPHEGAILDLKSANQGLLLPRVDLVDFEILTVGGETEKGSNETAMGMTVYNTNAYALNGLGLYVWDGSRWNGINAAGKATLATCEPDYYEVDATKYVDITVNGYTGGDGIFVGTNTGTATPYVAATKTLRFLTYNLGANPNIAGKNATAAQIAKAQMAYVNASTEPFEDITVSGGLYQWGRKDKEHSSRCPINYLDYFTLALYTSATYNPLIDHKFVYGSNIEPGVVDWVSDSYVDDNRWGNGGGPAKQTDVSYNSGHPYSTNNLNNPCPTGFHVPTQHEWALLGNEGGSSTDINNDNIYSSLFGVITPTSGIIWVPVAEGKFYDNTTSVYKWENDGVTRGYALYKEDVWANAAAGYQNGSLSLTVSEAPNPLMFLPASGWRDSSSYYIAFVGSVGAYWSSTTIGTSSLPYTVWFMQIASEAVRTGTSFYRAQGMAVRCVSEL